MALTKKDKEEIKKMIQEALMGPIREALMRQQDTAVELTTWKPKVLKKSKMLGIEIADKNYWEFDEDGNKKEYFTWDEAMEIQKKLPDGWRLPTRSEWAIIAEEFGQDENGELNGTKLSEALDLPLSGYRDGGSTLSQGSSGYYWSSVADDNNYAYFLYLSSSYVSPQLNGLKWLGFTVRLVKDTEVKNER